MIISDKFGNGGHVMKIPTTMDDSSVSHQNGGQLGPQIGGTISDKQTEEPSQTPEYSIPGILHFIQHEWARFELERSQWEVDRAEFEARIAFLQGERKGLENLRNDLVRRIKMLEYALKQERGKFHKLKYGVELQQGDTRPPADEESELAEQGPEPLPNVTWRQGRQLIRQYFEEIGYAETILDVRSNRVRALLGLNNNTDQDDNISLNLNGNESDKRGSDTQGHSSHDNENRDVTDAGCVTVRRAPGTVKKALVGGSRGPASEQSAMLDGEAAVLANFEFLTGQEMDVDDLDDMDTKPSSTIITNPDEVDAEAEEVLNELDILSRDDDDIVKQENKGMIWTEGRSGTCVRDGDEDSLALGELAQLSVTNEADAYNLVQAKVSFRKTWNAKYTLRSHFDGVRALAFHPTESVLITASEDHTLKLWNLHKTVPAKKSANLDVEPLYTFRAHRGAVLCLAMGTAGQQCWSGGLDGAVRTWNVPPSTTDPYDAYEPDVVGPALLGHTDAVWSLAHCRQRLLSASADGTVRLWSPGTAQPLTSTLRSEADGAPTCVDFAADGTRAVASFQSAHTVIFDLETGKPVTRLEGEGRGAMRVVSHPSSPLTVTAHEDRHIRFWDNETGQLTHSMVAHLDAVTSLAVDPNGLFLLSGSHDCSIRLWNLDNKTCVQEITAHRKKFDESILDVAFHPARPYIASAGADALAKVFV